MAVGHILCTLLSNQQRRALPAFFKWGSRPFLEIEAGKGTQNDERAPAPPRWSQGHKKPAGPVKPLAASWFLGGPFRFYDFVERAKRYRDGSPLERLTMDIEDAERHCSGSP